MRRSARRFPAQAYANLNHAQKTYKAQQLLFALDETGVPAFREEVQLVLQLDCNEDRPLPDVHPVSGERPVSHYGPQTSGRLPDFKRKALMNILSAKEPERAFKMAQDLFTKHYPVGKNATKNKLLNKHLEKFQAKASRDQHKKWRGRGAKSRKAGH